MVEIPAQRINLKFDTTSTDPAVYTPIKWIKAYIWFLNRNLASASLKYKYLNWGWSTGPSNTVNTIISPTENKTTFNQLLPNADHRFMFVPKFSIDALNINNNPYIKYTYDTTTGIFSA